MMSEKHEKVEHDEKRPKRQAKLDYRKPELTRIGPVEEFTGNGVSKLQLSLRFGRTI